MRLPMAVSIYVCRVCVCVSVCSQPMMVDFGDGVCSCVCRLVGWQIAIYSYLR